MSLVASSLRRPITVVVLVIAVLLGAVLAVRQMSRDIFPTLGIPTIYVAQPYGGMDPSQMEGYLTYHHSPNVQARSIAIGDFDSRRISTALLIALAASFMRLS